MATANPPAPPDATGEFPGENPPAIREVVLYATGPPGAGFELFPVISPNATNELDVGTVTLAKTFPVLRAVPTDTVPVPGGYGVAERGGVTPAPPVAETNDPKEDVPPVPPLPLAYAPPPPPTTVTLTCVQDAGLVQVPGEVNSWVCS
jgi:hypothetical protein